MAETHENQPAQWQLSRPLPSGVNWIDERDIKESVHHCLIHNTLLNPPKISPEVQSVALVLKRRQRFGQSWVDSHAANTRNLDQIR